jgi:(S)-3,5-dihydroxyphenylglycine transaminase
MDVTLKQCFGEPLLEVMNFLNEVVQRYPEAISFAPGRPSERYFDVAGSLAQVARFVEHRAAGSGLPAQAIYDRLGQYGPTNGIINDLVARQIALDHGIHAEPDTIVITCGCQEGMAILLGGLFEPDGDVLLVSDPTYNGITGLARLLGIPTVPVPSGPHGLDAEDVAAAVAGVERSGRRARAVYDIPDFNNPQGTRLSLPARHALLDMASENGLLIFEDNPYGMFAYDSEPLPPLKALDEHGVVVYMGSFSKTLFPGLRMGYLVADQQVVCQDGRRTTLAAELSKVKSLTTVNTPPLLQAVVGGILVDNQGSLAELVRRKLPFYRENRDRMLRGLDAQLSGMAAWNRPEGGFFLTVDLPFVCDEACLEESARDFGVIFCPMRFFDLSARRERQARLSFSYVTPEQIDLGVERFARFVQHRLVVGALP